MLSDAPNDELLAAWKNGNQEAAEILFSRYQTRLIALVRSRLSQKLARRVDPEDIVMSAYRSFFIAARDGRATASQGNDLWPLLTTIALRKLARQSRQHKADRRSINREDADAMTLEYLGENDPTAEHAAVLSEEIEHLISKLDETAREVLVGTLQGNQPNTIAMALGLNERTIRRALERIREHLPVEDSIVFARPIDRRLLEAKISNPSRRGTVTYDDYVLKQFLGAGSFSKVYRAIDRKSADNVAIKFLRKECWSDERAIAAVIREYGLLKQLQHPGILRMRDWGTTPRGGLFLVTDFIDGMNLAESQAAHSPRIPSIIPKVISIANAVSAAHSSGILHCDLKPSNVLVSKTGEVILCDFGLARHATDPDDVPRGGTAGFLSPEQISDAFGPVTERSDVYGLGALLYSLLTGSPPMQGRDLPETLANVLSSTGPSPPSTIGESTTAIDEIVMRCLQKEPRSRYATIDEVVCALTATIEPA